MPDAIQLGEILLDPFFGLGLSLRSKSGKNNNEAVFGPRLPVGVAYEFTDPNVEAFAQGAINIGLIPSLDLFRCQRGSALLLFLKGKEQGGFFLFGAHRAGAGRLRRSRRGGGIFHQAPIGGISEQ